MIELDATLEGMEETIAGFRAAPGSVQVSMVRVVMRLAIMLQRHVKARKLTGQVLNVQSGTLRRSITYRVLNTGQTVYGIVGTNVKYARIHEYGGTVTISEQVRTVKLKSTVPEALKGMVYAGDTFRTNTIRKHTAKYPERSFLRSSLKEMMPDISYQLRKGAITAINSKVHK